MKKKHRSLLLPVLTLLLVFIFAGASWAASISGTVVNSSGKTGRIYLSVQQSGGWNAGFGVSIAAAGNFTINGVRPGSYTVKAFVDTQGTGIHHANDPSGVSGQVTVSSANVSAGTITLDNPSPVAAQAPEVVVHRGSGGNFVMWEGPETDEGLTIADRYTVSWSTSPSGSPIVGTEDVAAGNDDFFAHGGGASSLYYQVKAVAGGTTASSGWTQVPAASGTGSVTGKVYFPGVSATGPLYVAAADFSGEQPILSVAAIMSPASGGSYTINDLPAGTYDIFAFLDLNNNGAYDAGDVGWLDDDDFSPKAVVSTTQVTAADITLNGGNASAIISTDHGKNQGGEWYNLRLSVQSMQKRVVNIQIVSGPQLTTPVDVAVDDDKDFETWLNVARPTVGDTYQINVSYLDGTTETFLRGVTAVLDGFPTSLAPVGYVPFGPAPDFSWTAPSPAPAEYVYNLWVNENNGGNVWDVWGMPSSQTSVVYGSQGEVDQEELSDGTTYNWTLNVIDRNGNRAQTQTTFTPTSAPVLTGFSPAGGLAGATVTISGINFNPIPASNVVLFNGVTASVSAATSTSLTVTVPAGAATGKIQVNGSVSTKDFIVAAPIHISGVIKTSADAAIAGARVERSDDPTSYTTTAADGSFTLDWLFPGQGVTLKISKNGYVPTYTASYYLDGDRDLTPYPSHLYTQAELSAWGVNPGKGVIVGQVLGQNTTPYSPLSGVVVTAASSQNQGNYYAVSYFNGSSFGGNSTYGNGLFFVLNVNDNDWVNMNASKSPWNFSGSGSNVRANSVTEGGIFGNAPSPFITGFSPMSGKVGTSVAISGSNFSSIMAENIVKFNGATATVTAASSGALTVTVPSGATSGQISVTTAGGTTSHGNNFTMRHTLSASVTGNGGGAGTVTSVPAGISCRTDGCTADFDQGEVVELVATEDEGSIFSAWSGACTGAGVCLFTMNGDKAVTATFDPLLYIKKGSNYYSSLQAAFDAAMDQDIIQAQAQIFTINSLVFDKNGAQVTLEGGYDSTFTANTGFSLLHGMLTIGRGTLTIERMMIQ